MENNNALEAVTSDEALAEDVALTENEEVSETEEISLSDEHAQKTYEAVKGVLTYLNTVVEQGTIEYYDIPEVLSIALSSSIKNIIPANNDVVLDRETDQLMNYLWKQFNHKLRKKNYMFSSQLLAPAKFTSYVVIKGVQMIHSILAKRS